MKTRILIITVVASYVLMVSLHPSYAQYLGNSETYSFVVDDKNPHEIRFQSQVTSFEEVFYDDDAQSIIAQVNSDSQLSDNILLYLHADSFYELFGDNQQATPTDVLVLLDGVEQDYDVLPKAPRNDYIIWEFKSMPNIREIEIILEPKRYRDDQTAQTLGKSFTIIEKQVRHNLFYDVTSGSINNVQLNCNSPSLTLSVLSDHDGTMQLDIPKGMLEGIFMVLVDGKEWDDVSIDGNIITVHFTKNTSIIEILGSYNLSTVEDDGVCDVIHNPPYSYILPPLKQIKSGIPIDKIQCKENIVLVEKYDGSPVCVHEQTIPKLIERGWLFDPANNIIKQCAIEYDKIMRIPECPSSGDGPVCEPKPLIAKFIEPSDEIANFKKMHCADNVGEWSHLTEHEEDPNNGQIDWKLVSGIHHENPTFDVYGLNEKFQPIKVGEEIRSTIQYWDIVSCFDAETRIIDKLTNEIIFENIYTYECKNKQVGTFDKMMLRITDDVNWKIKLPGFYVLELESEKINLTEEFFVECTSGGCEFLTDEQLEGRQKHQGHYD